MRKVKGYQRRDVGVLREQSGRLPVTSNDSQFTMFTKRERAIAVQLSRDSSRRFLLSLTCRPRPFPPPLPLPLSVLISASELTGQVDLAKRRNQARCFNIPPRNLTQMRGSKCGIYGIYRGRNLFVKLTALLSLARAFCLRSEFTGPK